VTVALATSAEFPHLDDDSALALPALAAAGLDARPARWDDPAEDWSAYELVVIRSTWDYTGRRGDYVTWARSVPALANPAPVVAWNTDKRYLRDLAGAGVPVVPTAFTQPGENPTLPADGDYVIKPAISGGARDSGRYRAGTQDELARAHAARLLGQGRTLMIQPYQDAVDTDGETALLFLGGEYSHAATKAAILTGPDAGDGGYPDQHIARRTPTAAQHALARAALAAVPGGAALLYARVDMVPGPDGDPLLLELELTEPSLFLRTSPGAPQRFAAAIAARLR
jgi:hypothetical protein